MTGMHVLENHWWFCQGYPRFDIYSEALRVLVFYMLNRI